jgi:hypothetical protein
MYSHNHSIGTFSNVGQVGIARPDFKHLSPHAFDHFFNQVLNSNNFFYLKQKPKNNKKQNKKISIQKTVHLLKKT